METLHQASGAKLLLSFFDRNRSTKPIIDMGPQKPVTPKKPLASPLPRSTPEKEGISSGHLAAFIKELSQSDSNLHSLMVLKNGKVVAECFRKGYSPDIWHSTFSLCKTVTGIAVGMLWDEGLLDINTPLHEIFGEQKLSISKKLRPAMTVRNLLTMTSGAEFAETGAVMYEDWVETFFGSSLKFDPGKRFNYNSMNSYMLAAVVQRITGETLCDYLQPRLFEPLGIDEYYWETCPKGIEKGGFGMYLKTEDMAKLGQLLLQNGLWQGKRILSEQWVREMTSAKVIPESESDRFNYGYHVWTGKKQQSFLLNGLFGQNVIGYRDSGIVIATTGGSSLCFHDGSYFDILDKYFGAPVPEKGGFFDAIRLMASLDALSKAGCPIWERKAGVLKAKKLIKAFEGRELVPCKDEPSLGVLPKVSALVQNNHANGISGLLFRLEGSVLHLEVQEGSVTTRLQFGLKKPIGGRYDWGGERYLTCGSGKICLDEDGDAAICLRLDLIETASSRLIKLHFKKNGIYASMKEEPGIDAIEKLSDLALSDPRLKRFVSAVSSKIDTDYISHKLREAMEPVFEIRFK